MANTAKQKQQLKSQSLSTRTGFWSTLGALFAGLTELINELTKAITRILPKAGSATYQTVSMADDAIVDARRAMLIRNQQELNLLLGKSMELTPEQEAAIEAKLEY